MKQLGFSFPPTGPSLQHLFTSFFELGMVSFGGPPMVAYIRTMVVEKKKWLDDALFQDGVALCQMIPGIITMQTAAYVGLRLRGIAGAAASFLGFGLPAFLFMTVLSALYVRTAGLPAVVSAFHGLQAIIVALVAHATFSFGRTSLKSWSDTLIAGVAFVMFLVGMHPILAVIISGGMGTMFHRRLMSKAVKYKFVAIPYSRTVFSLLLVLTAVMLAILFFIQRDLFSLAFLMGKITVFAFGGGFTALPLMFHEIVKVRSWMDAQTFLNGIALGQITPGPIMITATFVGYLLYGLTGALIATLGIFLPSFLIVIGVAPYYERLHTSPAFTAMIRGILCSFVGLLLSVTIHFAQNIPWDFQRTILACAAFLALLLKTQIIWVVVAGIIISVLAL